MLTKKQITFDLSDPAGVLFFANAFSLAHQNLENIVRNEWGLWEQWFNHKEIAVPLRHAEADYLQPMFAGNEYTLSLKLGKISERSVVLRTEFLDEKDNVCAAVRTTHVFVNKLASGKATIPSEIKDKLESLPFV